VTKLPRLLLAGILFLTIAPRGVADAAPERGRTLAAACAECHTAPGGAAFAGGHTVETPSGTVLAPNITPDRKTGIGGWSEDELIAYLRTGHNAHATATGPMAEIVAQASSRLSAPDLHALAVYLAGIPAVSAAAQSAPAASDPAGLQAGKAIYSDVCTACHGWEGAGTPGLFPALRGSAVVTAPDPAGLLATILHGARTPPTDAAPTGAAMPSFGRKLDDAAIATVATFLRSVWGNSAAPVDAATVAVARRSTR
jgi:mono/diheme cytochrome c family protein